MTPLGQVDLSRQRDTEGWNYICAAFISGTNISTNETDIITVVDSSDDDNKIAMHHLPLPLLVVVALSLGSWNYML